MKEGKNTAGNCDNEQANLGLQDLYDAIETILSKVTTEKLAIKLNYQKELERNGKTIARLLKIQSDNGIFDAQSGTLIIEELKKRNELIKELIQK